VMNWTTFISAVAMVLSVNGFLLSAEWTVFVIPAKEELKELHSEIFLLQRECVKKSEWEKDAANHHAE